MAGTVLVVAEQRAGELNSASLETLVAGQRVASARGLELAVALPGQGCAALLQQFATYRADRLVAVEHAQLETYGPEAYTAAVHHVVQKLEPEWVLFPNTYQVRDFAPRVAARCGRSLISDCIDIRDDGGQVTCVRQVFQGKLHADVVPQGDAPHFVSFQAAAFSADDLETGGGASVETLPVDLDLAGLVTMQSPSRKGEQAVDLGRAEIIVAVGRGMQEEANLDLAKQLVSAIGGELAASRPVCDEGWLPLERQVGSSGQTVSPNLYIALGISGASQHLVGMKGSKTIVAVNKDPDAPIFKVADYGIVGDVLEVIPALVAELKA